MKPLVALLFSLTVCNAALTFNKQSPISNYEVRVVVSAIYKTEGAYKTPYPFGIRIGNHKFSYERARQICDNTVRSNHREWRGSGTEEDFISYLADRYCPQSIDSDGNKNWKKNMKYFLARVRPETSTKVNVK
jgi:hypothetical protein